ncbi:MAG: hypothetical protein PGN22_02790 [Agrobacterium cavarae]
MWTPQGTFPLNLRNCPETVEATGSLEAAQELATHSTSKMTKRYSRGDGLQNSRRVAEIRANKRK